MLKVVRMFEKATRGMGIYAKIAYLFLVSMGVLIPLAAGSEFYPIPATIEQYGLFKMCAFFILAGGAALFFVLDYILGAREVRWHPLMWWALGFGAISAVSYALSIDKRVSLFGEYDRFFGLVPMLLAVLLLFLTIQFMRNNAAMRYFMHIFVVTSVLLAFYGLLQSAGIDFVNLEGNSQFARRSFSLFGNPNIYAGYLCFSVFFSAGLLATEKRVGLRAFYWGAFLINLAVTLTSMTRSIWLACVLVGPLFIVFMARQKASFTKTDKIVSGAAGATGLAFVLFTLTRKTADLNIGTRLADIFSAGTSSSTRIEMWKTAIAVIKEHPLFGAGPDTFGITSAPKLTDKYISIMGVNGMTDNAHCMPLQLAATLGVAGMLSYYAVVVYGCILGFKYAWDNSEPKQRNARLLYASALCAVLAYTINALVSVAAIDAMPFFWLCLGFLAAPKARTVEVNVPAFATGSALVAVVVFVGSLIFTGCFVAADHNYSLAKGMQQGSSQQVQTFKKAMDLNPFESNYETLYLDALGGNYIARLSTLTPSDARNLITELNNTNEHFPGRVDIQAVVSYYYTAMALIFQSDDLINAALANNDEILKTIPYDITTMGNQGAIYRALGNEVKAQALRAKIVALGPDSEKKQQALSFIDSTKPLKK